ncbi:unnamed protein product [Lactuca virosa]|uniref:RING-type domain-containing protein n=1 Tax=Lactuca virosa TaxID=75947 RepID=A0AAU9PYZ9_9ASTR|nr:unnamed protein product [Lactuca virosa]
MEPRTDLSDLEDVLEKRKTMQEARKKTVTEGVDCIIPMSSTRNVRNVHKAWFANEDAVRKLPFGICFESYTLDNVSTAACGHPFCNTCSPAYISKSISYSPDCLTLRCLIPSSGVVVDVGMVNMFTLDEDKKKYRCYLLRTYNL